MIKYLWQLPQNILGIIILFINRKSKNQYKNEDTGIEYYTAKHVSNTGISLGNYIILDKDRLVNIIKLKHEHGHQIQSLYLGWLYLVVIGLPSLLGNLYHRRFHKKWNKKEKEKWYYSQPWEKWADKLGGVERNFDN